jgi:hypothetical protein
MRNAIGCIVALMLTLPTSAIIRRHDRSDSRYVELARNYEAVVDLNLPGGAGTLIAPDWLLTAAHAARLMKPDRPVKIAGIEYQVLRSVIYPGGGEGRDDLALIQLARNVENVVPVALYESQDEGAGDRMVTFAGRGFAGDGQTGPVIRDGRLRAATNRIDSVKQRWLVFCFDAPPGGTDLEGISGPGDSGGPAFITMNGQAFLAGVSSGQDSRATGKEGVYGVTEYYVRVSSYYDWIKGVIGPDGRKSK